MPNPEMDRIQNRPTQSLARDLVRWIVLVAILTDGLLLMLLSQVSSTNYHALARFELLNFVGFALLVVTYLSVTRMRNWKLLIPFSLLVAGFALEFFSRVY